MQFPTQELTHTLVPVRRRMPAERHSLTALISATPSARFLVTWDIRNSELSTRSPGCTNSRQVQHKVIGATKAKQKMSKPASEDSRKCESTPSLANSASKQTPPLANSVRDWRSLSDAPSSRSRSDCTMLTGRWGSVKHMTTLLWLAKSRALEVAGPGKTRQPRPIRYT